MGREKMKGEGMEKDSVHAHKNELLLIFVRKLLRIDSTAMSFRVSTSFQM